MVFQAGGLENSGVGSSTQACHCLTSVHHFTTFGALRMGQKVQMACGCGDLAPHKVDLSSLISDGVTSTFQYLSLFDSVGIFPVIGADSPSLLFLVST